jgi:hypothetical protein
MATGLILNKFVCYQTEIAFLRDLNAGYISTKSIVFVLDKQYIYSHGKYFYCEFSPEVQKIISASITELVGRMDSLESVLGAAINDLDHSKIGLDDLDVEALKNEIAEEGARVQRTTEYQVNAYLEELNNLIETTNLERIELIDRGSAAGISENRVAIEDNEKVLTATINEMKSQIRILQEQVNNLRTS